MPKAQKEIDKEAMFNKIMPSVRAAESSADPAHVSGIGAKRSVFTVNKALQIGENEPSMLVNLMEKMVDDRLDDAITKFHCCKCDKCKKDVAAIALNRLKPRYVVADKISVLSEERQTSSEVTTAIVQAILVVKAHPRH